MFDKNSSEWYKSSFSICDPDSDKSSAALSVNVGSLTDSPDDLGLAHFCEHLLFMGIEKYPDENDYKDYLSKNGGASNAFTKLDKTVYYFFVNNTAFEGALDRFAQFFISSKFSESSVEREINECGPKRVRARPCPRTTRGKNEGRYLEVNF